MRPRRSRITAEPFSASRWKRSRPIERITASPSETAADAAPAIDQVQAAGGDVERALGHDKRIFQAMLVEVVAVQRDQHRQLVRRQEVGAQQAGFGCRLP
jgi:hypothetical protein